MPHFFHVDRDGALSEGTAITLSLPILGTQRQNEVLKELFPEGVSRWGASMFEPDPPLVLTLEALVERGLANAEAGATSVGEAGANILRASKDRVAEVVAEMVRRWAAPQKPSRLAAVFAYRDQVVADDFRKPHGVVGAKIFRVSVPASTEIHKGDARCLGMPDTAMKLIDNAGLYWAGHKVASSLPTDREVLLLPPVTVEEIVA